MANINKIRLSGQTYNIQDPNAQPLLTAGQGITIENNVISATGGGSITIDTALDSGSTNPVENRVIYNKIDEVEEVTAAGLNALNDKINPTVELTQAQYNALVSGGTVDPNTYYIITDAQAGDLTQYWTSAQTNSAITAAVSGKADTSAVTESINAAVSGKASQTDLETVSGQVANKQDTLVSGTNIKTINNESILGSGNIDIQGGGKAIEAGRGISITTGETADTVSFDLPISATTNNNLIIGDGSNVVNDLYNSTTSIVFGRYSRVNAYDSLVGGYYCSNEKGQSQVFGTNTKTKNITEFGCGKYNNSVSGSSTFGDSGNTLFSVGNGTSSNARHNAFEIRQNGDIYITKDGQDVKLQDQLGGSSITVDTALSSTSENPVQNKVIYNKIDEVEQVTAAGLNVLNESKQDTLVSGTNIKTINNESILGSGNINIQGGGGTVESAITSGSTNAVESKAIWSATTFNKGVLLTFNEDNSTNYPEGCGKLVVNVGDYGGTIINFKNNEGWHLGTIEIQNFDGINISVDTSKFGGATYEISGTTVILSYPSTGITSVQTYQPQWTYTAVVEGAWVNDNTYMKSEVDAIASGLQNNINSKLDATAYTPTVVDSALNVASTNPIQNQALYSELRIDNGETETTLTFENRSSTNYPNGCTKLIVELVGSNNSSTIHFNNGNNTLGSIDIMNYGNIYVSAAFDGATYEISGTTVIINYPTVTSVTNISVNTSDSNNYVYKAIVALATPLKNQVAANTTALGGLSLVKLTQTEYDNLQVKDQNTLYIIVN